MAAAHIHLCRFIRLESQPHIMAMTICTTESMVWFMLICCLVNPISAQTGFIN